MCCSGETGHEFGISIASQECISVPEDGGGWSVETGYYGSLSVEMLIEELGELFGA